MGSETWVTPEKLLKNFVLFLEDEGFGQETQLCTNRSDKNTVNDYGNSLCSRPVTRRSADSQGHRDGQEVNGDRTVKTYT